MGISTAACAGRASLACVALLAGCYPRPQPLRAVAGDPAHGRTIAVREACGSCHAIPGLVNADGRGGPPLSHFARRTVIAGVLPNTPANLQLWLQDPQKAVPGNAMPNMALTPAQARDLSAYLYSLR